MPASDLGQAERRRTGKFTDVHGRRWIAQIDTISFAPCSPFTPDGWSAPWLPPDEYLGIDPEDDRGLVIDYARLERDRKARMLEYRRDLLTEATRQFGTAAGPMMEHQQLPDGRTLPHPAILAEVGLPPYGSVFARAAASGQSQWVLGTPRRDGTPYPMPEWAKPHQWELVGSFVVDVEDEAHPLDFSDEVDDTDRVDATAAPDLDRFGDLEEQIDPAALGGTRQRVRRKAGAGLS